MLARFALQNAKVIVFVVLVLALLGVRAYFNTPQSIFPQMKFARIDVVAEAGDLPPDRVFSAVGRPLSQAFETLPGVTNVTATASQGSAELVVAFTTSTDSAGALQNVDRAIAQVRASVPDAASIVAEAFDANREPIVSYALTSNVLSQTVLRQIALARIAPKLYGTQGLGQLLVTGGATPEYHVSLDPAVLRANALGAANVSKALAEANDIRSVGSFQRHFQRYSILLDAALNSRESLASVTVPGRNGSAIPLSALGTVSLGVSPAAYQTSFDGKRAVLIGAYAAPGADSLGMAHEFAARIGAIVPTLPADARVVRFWDQTTLIDASQTALRDAIAIGALLAVLVIYAFLRDARLTLVAAALVVLAMASAIFVLRCAGQTLNLMSVGGLAVAVGLIIDDAIVVIEGVARRRHENPQAGVTAAISSAASELSTPMIASTATIVVVFLPLILLSGLTGFFFRALAFTLASSLLVSLGLALFVAPIFARTLMRGDRDGTADADARIGSPLTERYASVLRWFLGNRLVVAAGAAIVFVATVVLFAHLQTDFLPKMDEGEFEIGYTLPPGISLAASDSAAREMERIVAADPAVASVAGLTGIDSNGVSPTQANQGALRIRLVDPNQRPGYEIVADRLRDRLSTALPASIFDFRQILEDLINDLSGSPAPIEISIFGDDPQRLNKLSRTIADKIGRLPNVVDAESSVNYDGPSLRIAPRVRELAAAPLGSGDIGDALAALGQGTIVTSLQGSQPPVPVRVSIANDDATASLLDPTGALNVGGSTLSMASLARSDVRRLESDIVTTNGRLTSRVTANFEGASLSAVVSEIRSALSTIPLPAGYSATIGGQTQTQSTSFEEFTRVIALAIVLVYAVMLATFRSFRIPLVILTAVPLASIGVALGLVFTQTALNVSSFMGLLLLVGVVVKNGILLIDVADRRREAGDDVREALLVAGKTRLRPIVMTTLAAIGGLAPLAIGFGQGSELEKPLAIAVIGGLSTATIFTLFVIPVIYATFVGGAKAKPRTLVVATSVIFILVFSLRFPALAIEDARRVAEHVSAVNTATLSESPSVPRAGQDQLVFSNLTLEVATTAALATSPDIRAARATVEENRFALAAAREATAPALVSSYVEGPQGNPPGPNVVTRELNTQIQITLGALIGAAPATREAAYVYAASELDEHAVEMSERVNVTALYYDALKARAEAGAASDALALADDARAAAQTRFGAGDAPHLDVVAADVAVAKAQAARDLAVARDANARAALAAETECDPAALDATEPRRAPDNAALPNALDAIELARSSRPEIASAKRVADAARAALANARAASIPAITLGAGYLTGTDSGVAVNAPTLTAGVSIPFGGAGRDRTSEALAKADELKARAESVERRILLDVAASARSASALERVAGGSRAARESARAVLVATEIGYRSGASSSLEVLSARSAYAQAAVDDLSARYDLAKARATLNIEIGR